MRNLTLTLTAALCLATAAPTHAGWFNDPYNGFVTVAGTTVNEGSPFVCALAGSRSFVAWSNHYYPGGFDSTVIFYQVLDQFGNALLPANGVPLISGSWQTRGYEALPDGQGGCISIFPDNRTGFWNNIWGQRVDSLGNRLWGATGMPLVIMPDQTEAGPKDFNSDSLGNFFLSYNGFGMFTQKFNAAGTVLWGPLGVRISRVYGYGQDYQQAVPDGTGGIIEVFENYYASPDAGLFTVQHLNAAGRPLLRVNGVPLRTPSGQLIAGYLSEGVSDGNGGGVWSSRHDSYPNEYVKLWRLNSLGQMLWLWTADNTSWNQGPIDLIHHAVDGTIWLALARVDGYWIYRFTLNGTSLFGNGIPYGGYLVPVSDGVISTIRQENPLPLCIHAQRIDSRGILKWSSDVAINDSFYNQAPTTNGADGVVIAFGDERHWSINYDDVLAQRVNADGTLGTPNKYRPLPQPSIANLTPGQISYIIDQAGLVRIDLFDLLGRRVALLEDGWREAGTYQVPWNDRGLVSGIYLLRMELGGKVQARKVAVVR